MTGFLTPPPFKPEMAKEKIDSTYKNYRWQVFLGIFIGYAGFYIVRKNFSMAIPALAPFGFEKGELGIVLSMNAIAYGFSKFLMASISDRSDARKFLPLGLINVVHDCTYSMDWRWKQRFGDYIDGSAQLPRRLV